MFLTPIYDEIFLPAITHRFISARERGADVTQDFISENSRSLCFLIAIIRSIGGESIFYDSRMQIRFSISVSRADTARVDTVPFLWDLFIFNSQTPSVYRKRCVCGGAGSGREGGRRDFRCQNTGEDRCRGIIDVIILGIIKRLTRCRRNCVPLILSLEPVGAGIV